MFESPQKLSFGTHLKVIYNWLYYCGLLHFKYDNRTRQFRPTTSQYIVSTLIFGAIVTASVVHFLFLLAASVAQCAYNLRRPIETQDEIILMLYGMVCFLSMFIVALNCLRYRGTLTTTLNEMLYIFNKIKRRSASKSYRIEENFQKIIVIKVCMMTYRLLFEMIGFSVFVVVFKNITIPHGLLLTELMSLSHVYSQMVLISFYNKMNDILQYYVWTIGKSDRTRYVYDWLALSFRIHRIKRSLNTFFTAVHVATYLRVINDIAHMYEFLKVTVYSKYGTEPFDRKFFFGSILNFWPNTISVFFDMFLVGQMSDMLVEVEGLFQKNIMKLLAHGKVAASATLDRQIEMMLIQNNLYDMNTLTLDKIKLNRQFSFDFLINVIIIYVISFLQFYASEAIYSAQAQ